MAVGSITDFKGIEKRTTKTPCLTQTKTTCLVLSSTFFPAELFLVVPVAAFARMRAWRTRILANAATSRRSIFCLGGFVTATGDVLPPARGEFYTPDLNLSVPTRVREPT